MIRRRLVIYGRVQGVFFRDTCRREAVAHRVAGWVANRPDGTVEAVFEGAEANVESLVGWAHRGPSRAQVVRVEVFDEDVRGESGFAISRGG